MSCTTSKRNAERIESYHKQSKNFELYFKIPVIRNFYVLHDCCVLMIECHCGWCFHASFLFIYFFFAFLHNLALYLMHKSLLKRTC